MRTAVNSLRTTAILGKTPGDDAFFALLQECSRTLLSPDMRFVYDTLWRQIHAHQDLHLVTKIDTDNKY